MISFLPNMKYEIFIKANGKKYIPHLKRYLKYVLNIESAALEEKKILEKSIIFIDEDAEINEDWLDFFHKYNDMKIIILGLTRESNRIYVNLLDLSHLKANIKSIINRKKKPEISPFFRIKKFEQQIRSLFKGHGEESFVDKLNKIIQLLGNGPNLLRENMLEWNEYVKNYLSAGLENWMIFKDQFQKNKLYLKVCGFERKLALIEKNINLFQNYTNKLRAFNKDELLEMDGDTIAVNISYVNQINNILVGIQQKIDALYDD